MLETILKEFATCRKCLTIDEHRQFRIDTHGNKKSRAMIVGEAPGIAALNNDKYWTGAGGMLLRNVLCEVTPLPLEKLFYLTDLVKCWPNKNGQNRTPKRSEINNCSNYLQNEISILKPKQILLLGAKVYSSTKFYLLPSD